MVNAGTASQRDAGWATEKSSEAQIVGLRWSQRDTYN